MSNSNEKVVRLFITKNNKSLICSRGNIKDTIKAYKESNDVYEAHSLYDALRIDIMYKIENIKEM